MTVPKSSPLQVTDWRTEPTPALYACAWVGTVALAACVALLRPELGLVAGPLLVMTAVARIRREPRPPQLWVDVDRAAVLEGEDVVVTVRSGDGGEDLRVRVVAGAGLVASPPANDVGVLRADELGGARVSITMRGVRWGAYKIELAAVWDDDLLALRRAQGLVSGGVDVRIFPPPVRTRALLRAARTTPLAGELLASQSGEGIEFGDVRSFRPGDRARSLNWRATARRGEPMVTERLVERNADVVLFVDTFSEHGVDGPDEGEPIDTSLDLAVRGADALARGHARGRDRVGLVFFGGRVRWVRPGLGLRHVYKIAAALLDAEVARADWWAGIDVVPRQTIPAGALVVALSPLVDPRSLDAIGALRSRGFDVAVVDVLPALLAGRAEGASTDGRQIATRLFELRRRAAIARLRSLGIGVVSWRPGDPLDQPLLELQAFRRRMARRG